MATPNQDAPEGTDAADHRNFVELEVERDIESGRFAGRVLTRFPPEPNGYLHIGHAKAISTNFGIAARYGGQTNLRFDDTNPAKEDQEYVDAIREDVSWLGYEWKGGEHFASDYFDQLYGFAEQLIEKGLAYVCDLDAEQTREYRGTATEPGRNSPNRDRSVEENLDLFRRMRAGEFEDGARTLRARIDMASPNFNMRDPVLYRTRAHHHRTGDAWYLPDVRLRPRAVGRHRGDHPFALNPSSKSTAPCTSGSSSTLTASRAPVRSSSRGSTPRSRSPRSASSRSSWRAAM